MIIRGFSVQIIRNNFVLVSNGKKVKLRENRSFFSFSALSAPSHTPDVIIAHSTSSTSLVVKWSHVTEQYFNGKPIGYKVSYYPVGLKRKLRSVNVEYAKNTTELANLNAFTAYVINVSAVSSGGVGPGKITIAQTDHEGTRRCLSISMMDRGITDSY